MSPCLRVRHVLEEQGRRDGIVNMTEIPIYTPHPMGPNHRLHVEIAAVSPAADHVHRVAACLHHAEQYMAAERAAGGESTYWVFTAGTGERFCPVCRHLERGSGYPQGVWLHLQRATYTDRP